MFRPIAAQIALPTLGTVLLFSLATSPNQFFERLSPKWDVSYGTYIYGWPIQKGLIALGIDNPYLLIPISIVFAIGFGILSWKLVEEPILRFKPKPTP